MQKKSKIKISSNKSFGVVFFIVFLIISLWPLLNNNPLRLWSVIVAIIFLILGLTNSKLLTPLNKLWFKFGILLSRIISPIVLGFIFFAIVTPTGIIMRVLGKDLLNKKFDNKKKSYWINRDKVKSTMKQQF